MHTDEYEISLAREINHCQSVVRKITTALEARQAQCGMAYEAAVRAVAEGRMVMEAGQLAAWQEDIEALPQWEQRLQEYREALVVMRVSASRP